TCPTNMTLECPADTSTNKTGLATASDTCSAVNIAYSDHTTPGCGNTYTIARTWKATDACGNTSSCVQTIKVVDTTPPTITCPPDKQLQCGKSTDPSNTGTATASDTCNAVAISYSDTTNAPNCTGKQGIDRTWKATDACGNIATCVQHITYVDTTAPAITCPSNITVQCA